MKTLHLARLELWTVEIVRLHLELFQMLACGQRATEEAPLYDEVFFY